MVNVDTVYQKVLALANKEQRGYITPQEFNLFADQAQKEILDQYFYDINQFGRAPGNDTEYSDMLNLLEEKISFFEDTDIVTNGVDLPPDLYRLGAIIFNGNEAEQVEQKDFLYINSSPLTVPTNNRPIYTRRGNTVAVFGDQPTFGQPFGGVLTTITANVTCNYIRVPERPQWGYVVVNEKALFDPNPIKTTNFELHPTEENELIYKILKFAGITLEKQELAGMGQEMETAKVSQEKQ